MKLVVQIPCFNEAQTLPATLADIPRHIPGVDRVEILIIDDGSTDGTVAVAERHGVDHIISNKANLGLARSFRNGLEHALRVNADIIVNTDGDNQYAGADIPQLIAPILAGQADIVVGDRQTGSIAEFSAGKRLLQRLGSHVVRRLSGLQIPDAVSGFRALSRDAAIRVNIVSNFSYTVEMLIQAGHKRMSVTSVPVRTNPKTRDSRLFSRISTFIRRSTNTMVRIYTMYRPLWVFFLIGSTLASIGIIPILRFVYFYFTDGGAGHIQSLILGSVLLIIGFMTFLIGLVADLISFNRQLIELTLEKVRRLELQAYDHIGDKEKNKNS